MKNLIVCLLAVFCMILVTQPAFALFHEFGPPDLCGIIPFLPQCDDHDDDGEVANCSVVQTETDGCFEITCPDGSSAVVCDGDDGVSCDVLVSNQDDCVDIVCGESVKTVCNGVDGEDGTSCSIVDRWNRHGRDCYKLQCTDGTSAVICDGKRGRPGKDGQACWDLNGNGEGDIAVELPYFCHYLLYDPDCQEDLFTEDLNGDGVVDVNDCRGDSCHVEEVEGGVRVFCDDGTEAFVNHGDSCTVTEEDSCTTVIECEDGSVSTVTNGVSCFDLNGNCQPDLCDPLALEVFETCEDFFDYCDNPREDYENGLPLDCLFTEDVNSDGVVNSLDCVGPVGPTGGTGGAGGTGGTGTPGEDGFDCFDLNMNHLADPEEDVNGDGVVDVMDCVGPVGTPGVDADPCTVVDNLDGTVTVVCPDGSEVILGDPVTVGPEFLLEESEMGPSLCGTFGGSLIVFGFPMLGLYCARRKIW